MRKDLSKILIVDVEATCWEGQPPGGETSEIIEIGCALYDLNLGKVVKKEGILIRPSFSTVSPFCTQLTTITTELLNDQGVTFQHAVAKLTEEYSTKHLTWGSWGDYDRKAFEKNSELFKTPYPFGSTHLNIKNLFALKYRLQKEVGMERALGMLNLPLIGTHHRGVDDSVNIASLFKALL